MNNSLISIYTPTYKRHNLLRSRAIPSVLNQTYTNWEYIIVSDCIDPDLRMIINSYNDPRIRYYDIEHQTEDHNYDTEKQWYIGGSYAANFALDKIKGKYIARLDDDDCWSKNHLERALEYLLQGDYEFITSQYVIIKENKGILKDLPYLEDFLHLERTNDIKVGGHSTWFYKAELKKYKYNPDSYKKEWNRVNDTDLLERFYKVGVRMGFCPDVLTYIESRPNENEVGLKAVKERMRK